MDLDTDELDVEWMRAARELAWLSNAVDSAYCVGCVITTEDRKTILSTGMLQPQSSSLQASICTAHTLHTGYSRELPGNTHAEECALEKLKGRTTASATQVLADCICLQVDYIALIKTEMVGYPTHG